MSEEELGQRVEELEEELTQLRRFIREREKWSEIELAHELKIRGEIYT